MLFTLAEAKDNKVTRIPEISQCDPASDDFISLLNKGTRMLLRRGDWSGTIVPIYVCVQRGCVTWPRYYRSVRELNICGKQVPINNVWYRFINQEFYRSWGSCSGSISFSISASGVCGGMQATGYYSTFADVPVNAYIRAYPSAALDFKSPAKTVTIFGNDTNMMPLRTKHSDGTYSDGIVISLASPYGQSAVQVAPGAIRVIKDATQGQVRLYAYDPVNNVQYDLAVYDPSETTPNYARYQLNAGNRCNPCGVLALMKLEFVPALADTDLVLIQNPEALAYAMQSAKLGEAGNTVESEAKLNQAVKELNMDLRNDNPDDQISVELQAFGKSLPSYHGIGRVF